MDDLLTEFLTETNESLAVLDVELVHLEQNPNNPALINNIFRLVHTIKGTCGFLGLPRLETLAHAAENVLGKFRDGALVVTPEAVTLILATLDRIKQILSELERNEAEPAGDDADLIARLDATAAGKSAPAAAKPAAPPPPAPAPIPATEEPVDASLGRSLKPGEVTLDELEAVFRSTPGPVAAAPEAAAETVKAAPSMEMKADEATGESAVAGQNIRVRVDLLENLMTMVSELVLTRNQLLQMVRKVNDSEFAAPLQRLSLVTTELQEGVMKTRMQPIGSAWAKLPRIIRDLSRELGKKIDLQMIGAETELDRQVLELIKDPLTHMVRNSADHGLERPEERVRLGKAETGKVVLQAYHEGGHIIIEIRDDGRGLDTAKIRAKALEKSLASEAELDAMSERELMRFIFKPGFSTAAKVTSVSGRGVGMDVVRTNIEKIGGTIDLRSDLGKGSVFTIKIPLTLAIVSALIVESAGERFAVPQISVIELVRASPESEQRIERIETAAVLRLRNQLLPLVFLNELLGLEAEGAGLKKASEDAYVVVTQVGNHRFGMVVDRVFDTEEIVVKPVAPILRNINVYSGNTILGDGSVIMILDPNGVAQRSGQQIGDAARTEEDAGKRDGRGDERTALLLFRAGGAEPKAVPLALVARLEEVETKDVETVNGQMVVQYRGKLMPLVSIGAPPKLAADGRQPVVVFADRDHNMGLMVDEIVDIVDDRLTVELKTRRDGVLGSAVIAGKATEVIDVGHIIAQGRDDWFGGKSGSPFGGMDESRKVLLVDDSPFFRNMLAPLLQVAGYEVTTAENAEAALKLREDGAEFDLILSDIEMPGMDGFAFAEAVRQEGRWRQTPIVALSGHASQRLMDRGREVGFADYVPKLDRDALLASLEQTLNRSHAA